MRLAKRQFLTDNKPRIDGFLRAVVEATHFVKTRRAEALAILARYTRSNDQEALNLIYDEYVQKVWPQVPEIQADDVKLVLEQLGETMPKALELNPAELIYEGAMDNIVKSNFVKQLYR